MAEPTVGKEYDPDKLNEAELPKFDKDGNVVGQGLMTPEQAMKLSGLDAEGNPVQQAPVQAAPADDSGQPAKVPEATPDKKVDLLPEKITIGGVEKTKAELIAAMEESYGVDTSKIPEVSRDAMLEGYIAKAHDGAWKKSNTENSVENARVKRENARERERLQQEQSEIAYRRRKVHEDEKALKNRKEVVTPIASTNLAPESIYDDEGRLDPTKNRAYNKQEDAKEELQRISEEENRLRRESAQAESDRRFAEAKALILEHPEYTMERSFEETLKLYEQKQLFGHPDVEKVLDLYDIMTAAEENGMPFEMAYQRLLKQGKLTVTATAPANPQKPITPSSEQDARDEQFRKLKQRQSGAQIMGQAGSVPSRPELATKVSLADKIRSHSSTPGSNSPALTEMNY